MLDFVLDAKVTDVDLIEVNLCRDLGCNMCQWSLTLGCLPQRGHY